MSSNINTFRMRKDWAYKSIGEICEIVCGQDYKSVQDDNGAFPIYGTGGIMGRATQYRCPAYSTIIGRKGNINNPLYVEEPFWNVDTAFGVVPKDVFPKYFFYFCKSYDFTKHDVSVTIPSLRRSDILKINVPVPSLSQQERIVAELDLLTGIINMQRAQLKEYDTLARSIFYDMFGDPEENKKGWEVKEMGSLFEIGSSKRVFESEWTDSGVPFYRAREIVRLSKNEAIDSPIFISEDLYRQYSKKYGVPSAGDIMVTAVGTLGVSYIVQTKDRFYFKDGNTLWFKSRGLCESRFIKDQYSTAFVVNQIQGNANAAVVGTYTIMNAKKTRVVVPPRSLQKEYVRKVQAIDNLKETINKAIKETQTLFDYTIDKYFG